MVTWRHQPPRQSFRRVWRSLFGASVVAVPPRSSTQPPRGHAWRTPCSFVRHVAYVALRRGVARWSRPLPPPRVLWAWRPAPPRRGAWRFCLFGTPRVAYVVLFCWCGAPRGFLVPYAWRTALFPEPPRRSAWRSGTPRVACGVGVVRHAFASTCPCVLSDRGARAWPASVLVP